MATAKLTKKIVDGATYESPTDKEGSPCYLWDTEIRGFGVRVYPSGRKSYVIHYRNEKGRWRFFILGNTTHMTLHQARELARKRLFDIAAGKDPAETKKYYKEALTVSDLCDRYLEQYAKKRKRSWKDDDGRITLYIKPALGSRKINDVRRANVAALHSRISEHSIVAANRTLSLLSVMYKQAMTWGLLSDDYPNPAVGIRKIPESSRERYLSADEAAALLKAADQEDDIRIPLLIRLYFYTAARKNELLKLKWEDVDFDGKRLRFRHTKAGRDHYIKPAPDAWNLLEKLAELRELHNPYVFPGIRQGDHLHDIKRPWLRIREKAKLPDIRLHDLRRTAASWLAQAGVSTVAIQKVLDHAELAATEVYARMSGEDTAGPFVKLGVVMAGVEKKAANDSEAKVIPLQPKKKGKGKRP